jgi:hypothetical protein
MPQQMKLLNSACHIVWTVTYKFGPGQQHQQRRRFWKINSIQYCRCGAIMPIDFGLQKMEQWHLTE